MLQIFTKKKKDCKGFTLIELLVVIAIIGILASIVLVSLNKARSKARDAKRQGDLRNVAVAAEMFYDAGSKYPQAAAWSETTPSFETYLTKNPLDPINNTIYYHKWVDNSLKDQRYTICTTLENPVDVLKPVFIVTEGGSKAGNMTTDCVLNPD